MEANTTIMEAGKKGKKPVVIYIRVSTDEQATEGYSLENQEHDIKEYCEKEGYEVVATYSDAGISGKNIEKREGLKQALRMITNNKAEGIVVWKMSRLSRNIADVANITELLKKQGAFLVSIKDRINTADAFGGIFAVISGIFAEMERENMITQIRGGMCEKARKGEWNGGITPLGYDLVDKALIINKREKEVVTYIFNEYIKGNGYKAIAKQLNDEGYKTRKNKHFSGNSVKGILTNVIYTGRIRWGKLDNWSAESENGSRKRKYNENVIDVKGVHEAIIDPLVFEKVQEMIVNNPRHHVKQFKSDHVLSGLLRCPTCGYGMSVQKMHSKGKDYYYYACNQYVNKKSGCTSHLIPKDEIEEQFYDIFEKIVNEERFHNKILKGLDNTIDQIKLLQEKEKSKQREINKEKLKQGKIMDEILEGDDNYKQVMREKLQEVLNKIKNLEGEVQAIYKQIEGLKRETINLNEVSAILKSAGKALKLMPRATQKEIVRKLVSKLQVENKSIKEVHFNFEYGFGMEEDTLNRITNRGDFLKIVKI